MFKLFILWMLFSVIGTFFTWVFRAKGAGYGLGLIFTLFVWGIWEIVRWL